MPVRRIDPGLAPAFEHRMHGHQPTLVENADLVRELMHLDDASGAIRNAVVVAAN